MSRLTNVVRGGFFVLLSTILALCASAFAGAQASGEGALKKKAQDRISTSSRLFLENKGQWDPRAKFFSRIPGANVWVTSKGMVLDYYRDVKSGGSNVRQGHVVGMTFDGAAEGNAVGRGKDKLRTDFLNIGKGAPVKNAASYREVMVENLYDGVDLRAYYDQSLPRYDLIVAPGANAAQIKLRLQGADAVRIDKSGDLVLKTSIGDVKQGGLFAYQMIDGKRKSVPVSYRKVGKNLISFKLGRYDRTKQLVIDPLVYGSYYGGDGGWDVVKSIVADTDGGVYFTGYTRATNFPTIYGPYGFNLQGGRDAFVSKLQGDAYAHDYSAYLGGSLLDEGSYVALDPHKNLWVAGITQSSDFPGNTRPNIQYLQNVGQFGTPTGGTFTLSYGGNATAPIAYNANAATVQAALEALPGLAGMVTVTGGPLPGAEFKIVLDNSKPLLLGVNNAGLLPGGGVSAYGIYKPYDLFLIRFAKDINTVLNPLPTISTFIGGDRDEQLAGLAIVPNENPIPGTPVEIALVGTAHSNSPMPEIVGIPMANDGFVLRYTYTSGGGLVQEVASSRYMSNGIQTSCSGTAMAADGSLYVSGTVYGTNNVDTSINPLFVTTPGVFFEGRLLRKTDIFVRRYDSGGNLMFSALLGGNDDDTSAGLTLDAANNVYLTGVSRSFNFPRTRGVYGENFSAQRLVFATKINQDASQIIWSTHLNTTGWVDPMGIAVDNRGYAYIAGTVEYNLTFPPLSDVHDSIIPGTIPTTPDGLKTTNTQPNPPETGTTDAFLLVLNSSATNLSYGTYLGGNCDDYAFAPYIDQRGDVWVVGSTDSARQWFHPNSGDFHAITGQLPDNHLAPFAFKRFPDANGLQGGNVLEYGLRYNPFQAPPTISTAVQRDGFLIKLRQTLPTIQSLVLNPPAIAGGLGAFTTATITLTNPAPSGGLDLDVTLNNTAASLDPNQQVNQLLVNVPAGQSVATFPIYSNVVTGPTQVQVRASLEGNFMIAQLTVEPWLAEITVSPFTVVGGNNAIGRVRLFQVPTEDIDVQITTDNSGLVTVPQTVTVPAGQDTMPFTITTEGVTVNTAVPITASLLGVGRTQTLTLTPASLLSLTFVPNRVTGGSASVGTVRLNGKAGGSFDVDLTINAGTPGYQLIPQTITFDPGDTQKTFTVQTVWEPTNTQRVITATRQAQGPWTFQQISGTLFIDNSNLISFTINPSIVNIGQNSVGTVTISQPAGPNGAIINLQSSDTNLFTVPSTVTIPSGATSANFTITTTTNALTTDQSATISANFGPNTINRTITVRKTTMGFTITPNSVVGGQTATGRISLGAPAPAGGVDVQLLSNRPEAQVPVQVTVPQGATFVTFPITTTAVSTQVNATISASAGALNASANLNIRPVSVVGITFTPNSVRGGSTTLCTITLDSTAPVGGAVIQLMATNPTIVNLPAQVTINGSNTISFSVLTNRVSRDLSTVVTAIYQGSSASTTLTVKR